MVAHKLNINRTTVSEWYKNMREICSIYLEETLN